MRYLTKTAVLVALAGVSLCLSVALLGLRHAQAQTFPQLDAWVADDAARAVGTLLETSRFTYLDQAMVPGMYRNAPLPVTFKALRSKSAGVKIQDRSFTYLASRPKLREDYKTKNAYPRIQWTPIIKGDLPTLRLKGVGDTKFEKVDPKSDKVSPKANEVSSKGPVLTDRGSKEADKFAVSLKSEAKTGKIAVTRAQLRAFKGRIKAATRDETGSASAVFPGSLDDRPAVFVPIVRVSGGIPKDFRITATPIR